MFSMKDESLQYNVIFRPEPEGGFTALVPSLPGCISYGKDLTETKEMITDAIQGYVASLQKHNEPVPYHASDLKKGTLLSIIKSSGLSREYFNNSTLKD